MLLWLVRGAIPIATRGHGGGGSFFSFLRNNLRRFLLHHPSDVEGDDEEDDEGSHADAEEDGHDGRDEVRGNEFLPTPIL